MSKIPFSALYAGAILVLISGCVSSPPPVIGAWSAPKFGPDGKTITFSAVLKSQSIPLRYTFDSKVIEKMSFPVPSGDSIAEPTFSPDGSIIAFVWQKKGTAAFEICTVNSDGTDFQQLTSSGMRNSHLFFSPDGHKIGFTRTSSKFRSGFQLGVIELSSNTEKMFPATEAYSVLNPSFSSSSKTIAYSIDVDYDGELNQDLLALDIETASISKLISHKEWIVAVYKPGSDAIVFDGTNTSKADLKRLTKDNWFRKYGIFSVTDLSETPEFLGLSNSSSYHLSISPDGSRLVYMFAKTIREFDLGTHMETTLEVTDRLVREAIAK